MSCHLLLKKRRALPINGGEADVSSSSDSAVDARCKGMLSSDIGNMPVEKFGEMMLRRMGYDPKVQTTKPAGLVRKPGWFEGAAKNELHPELKRKPCEDDCQLEREVAKLARPRSPFSTVEEPTKEQSASTPSALEDDVARVLSCGDGLNEISVKVLPSMDVQVIEAGLNMQTRFVGEALRAPLGSASEDPYGLVLWPAAVVVASVLATWLASFDATKRPLTMLEIGAGCGLVSLTAAKLGLQVLASDYRPQPLQLLEEAARRQGLQVSTQILDLRDANVPLPSADLVVGSDLFYESDTVRALAQRVAEARKRGSRVLIGHTFRPWRDAFVGDFIARLQDLLPEEATNVRFDSCQGVAVGGERHSSIVDPHSNCLPGRRIDVDLLCFPPI